MKNSKKIVALVLAMVMIFALTASALAATNAAEGVTVRVTVKGILNAPTATNPSATETIPVCTAQPYKITSGLAKNSVYDLVNTMDYLHSFYGYDAVWKTVALSDADGNPTGGTGQVLVSLSNTLSGTSSNASYPNYVYNVWANTSKTTKTFNDSVFTSYQYVYTGYAWTYKVNGTEVTDKYMDQYVLSDGDLVELTYQYVVKPWEEYFTIS